MISCPQQDGLAAAAAEQKRRFVDDLVTELGRICDRLPDLITLSNTAAGWPGGGRGPEAAVCGRPRDRAGSCAPGGGAAARLPAGVN